MLNILIPATLYISILSLLPCIYIYIIPATLYISINVLDYVLSLPPCIYLYYPCHPVYIYKCSGQDFDLTISRSQKPSKPDLIEYRGGGAEPR